MTLYKILVNGKSCHGGDMAWSLPRETSPGHYDPGQWMGVEGDLSICNRGIHLTNEPFNWYKWGCTAYEAEAEDFGGEQTAPHKIVCRKARLIRPVAHPQWWMDTVAFVDSLPSVAWLKPDGAPDPAWKLFASPSRAAAWAAARAAAWAAAGAAAGEAALLAQCIVAELTGPHMDHAQARMEVWRKGYALLCDVNGALYVYAATGEQK